MLSDLSQGDFKFWTKYAGDMRTCHENEFLNEIDPNLIRCFYRGKRKPDGFQRIGTGSAEEHTLMLSTIFSAANTILPNLYYQNPKPIVTAIRGTNPFATPDESAALQSALIRHYMKVNNAKRENQDAVLNGYFFGLGWKKVGYTVQTEPAEQVADEPEIQGAPGVEKLSMMSMNPMLGQKPDVTAHHDVDMEEGLTNTSESPLNVMLDHKADLVNGKVRLHTVPRTLHDLMSFAAYDKAVLDEIYQKFRYTKGSRFDAREIDLKLNELHIKQRNGMWILTWVDEFDKPIQYERSTLQDKGFQLKPLVITNEPGVRYPTSHMKQAVQVQDKIDKMASIFYEHVARARNILLLNEKDLAHGMADAIMANRIQGIVLTQKPITPGTAQHLQSPAVQNDLPSLMAICQQNLIEVMGTDSQMVQGKSKNDTLGQDELARVGSKIRESGIQDRVRDFMIDQFEAESKMLSQYCDAELKLEITGEDFVEPIAAEKFEKTQVEFMTQANPIAARRFIENTEYNFDMNVDDAVRQDSEKLMNDIERVIAFTSSPVVADSLLMDGVKIRHSLLAKEWMRQVSSLGNPMKYIEKLDSMQVAAIQAQKALMGQGGQAPKPPSPATSQGAAGKPPKEGDTTVQSSKQAQGAI